MPKPKPVPELQAIVEDPTLFSSEVKSKMEEPSPEEAVEPLPMQAGDHWETIHVAPALINKDMDWSFCKHTILKTCTAFS